MERMLIMYLWVGLALNIAKVSATGDAHNFDEDLGIRLVCRTVKNQIVIVVWMVYTMPTCLFTYYRTKASKETDSRM